MANPAPPKKTDKLERTATPATDASVRRPGAAIGFTAQPTPLATYTQGQLNFGSKAAAASRAGEAVQKKLRQAITAAQRRRPRARSMPYDSGVAAEPGLDYRHMDVEGFDAMAEVTVTDYCAERCFVRKMAFYSEIDEFFEHDRPEWSKVRWINVDGLNWDCIRLLATKFNLHRLAIEDLLSVQRTKIDSYQDHIYVCLLMHVLIGDDHRIVTDGGDSASIHGPNAHNNREHGESLWSRFKALFRRHKKKAAPSDEEYAVASDDDDEVIKTPMSIAHNPDRNLIYEEVKGSRESNLTVAVEQVSIFLTENGTVITFFQQSGHAVEKPIVERLGSASTILRTSEDASLLLQSIIDAIVDLSFPIATAYQELVTDLEIDVLTNPKMEHTRELHIVSGELSILKRTLYPLYNVVNALRHHGPSKFANSNRPLSPPPLPMPNPYDLYDEIHRGADISPAAKLYLADVADHVLILSEEVDQLRGMVENMINMIFNMVATTQSETMRQLTTVTIIFLPLTFLTGYFGMNFTTADWSALTNNGPLYFWQIAIPTTVVVVVALTYTYLRRLLRILRRSVRRKGVKIKLKKNREMRRRRGSMAVPRSPATGRMKEEHVE